MWKVEYGEDATCAFCLGPIFRHLNDYVILREGDENEVCHVDCLFEPREASPTDEEMAERLGAAEQFLSDLRETDNSNNADGYDHEKEVCRAEDTEER